MRAGPRTGTVYALNLCASLPVILYKLHDTAYEGIG